MNKEYTYHVNGSSEGVSENPQISYLSPWQRKKMKDLFKSGKVLARPLATKEIEDVKEALYKIMPIPVRHKGLESEHYVDAWMESPVHMKELSEGGLDAIKEFALRRVKSARKKGKIDSAGYGASVFYLDSIFRELDLHIRGYYAEILAKRNEREQARRILERHNLAHFQGANSDSRRNSINGIEIRL